MSLYPGAEHVHVGLVHDGDPHSAQQRYRDVVEVDAVSLRATALVKWGKRKKDGMTT